MNETVTERDLLLQFKKARKQRNDLKDELKRAQYEYDKAEAALMEFLEANQAIATAKYEGLGYAQIQKPRLYASCRNEDLPLLFEYLKEQNREDLIKTTVMPQSLSSFASERIEEGFTLPDYVKYYFKNSLRLY